MTTFDPEVPGDTTAHKAERHDWRRKALIYYSLVGAGIVVGAIAIALYQVMGSDQLTPRVLRQVSGFIAYYPSKSFATDFKLNQKSVSYSAGVLVFEMTNPVGHTLAFTEQATSAQFSASYFQQSQLFNTEYGQGIATSSNGGTAGTLFTRAHTTVVINAPSPIGTTLMQEFLQALVPDK